MRSADLRRSGLRVKGIGVLLILAFGILTVRAAHLTVIDSRGEARGDSQTVTVLRVPGARGAITDRHGAELALTIEVPSVYAVPSQIGDLEATTRALAKALGHSRDSVRARLRKSSPFVFVARWIEPGAAQRVAKLELPGIGLVEEPRRTYPHRALAGRLIGFANIDGRGARAVEQMEDEWLAGQAQRVGVERDARQRLLPKRGFDPRKSIGGDVALTLDAVLQAEVETALIETVERTGARGGVVAVLDPNNGDVLALAEAPSFDPNRFRTTRYPETAAKAFLAAPEPGSTLKPVTVAAALEVGAIDRADLFDCEKGRFRVPGKVIRDVKPHGLLDAAGILRVSSNIGAAKIGFEIGARRQHEVLRRFGFGAKTGSGFPDESAGLLRPWNHWRTVDHANVSFGQGMNATVVQMAAAMAALAQGGEWRAPRLVSARRQPGGRWLPTPRSESRRVVREDVARQVMQMLEAVVGEKGTGRRAGLFGQRVAGKTGTAQKLDRATGTYSQTAYRAWFIGAAPAEAPQLAIAVMIDEPRGKIHGGGSVAAPLFARAASAGLGRLGIAAAPLHELPDLARIDLPEAAKTKPDARPTQVARSRAAISRARPDARTAVPDRPAATPPAVSASAPIARPRPSPVARLGDRVLLPDFRGLTRRQVESMGAQGLRLQLRGQGLAVEQFPAPGTIVAGASAISVRFEGGI